MVYESVPTDTSVSFYFCLLATLNLTINACIDNKYLFEIRQNYADRRHDTESFFRELQGAGQGDSNKTKFDVIAGYCNKDLFSGINDPVEESKSAK